MTVQSTDDKNEQQFHLDGILSELGSFGKYQLLLLLLLAFRDSFLNMCNYNFVFTATEIPFRCNVSQCASTLVSFNSSWASYTISNSSCYPLLSTWNSSCSPATFDRNRTVHCSDIIYENYNSIVAEFDLGCQPWKRTLIGTVHNLGLAVSFIISGIISDRYGRKVIIVGSPLIVGAAGILKSVVIDYWSLLTLEFIETALGYGNASLVLALEVVSQKNRVAFSCILDILGSIGGALFGLIAWKIPYWRNLMRAIYAPLLIVVFYTYLMDEGVRWLLAHNRIDEAVYVLNRVAKINNITLSIKSKEMLTKISVDKIKADEMDLSVPVERPSVLSVLKSKTIFIRMVIIATSFFCCMFLFVGTIVNSTTFSGDQYVNFSAMMLVAVPTRIAIALTPTKFGRRAPICLAYCLCAIFFIVSAFVPKSIISAKSTMSWETALLYMASICSNYGFFSMLMVALEVFPTTSRNSLTNIANTIGRLGSALAPQTPLLEQYYPGLPNMVYGLAALGPALLALFLPNTSQTDLPDRLVDAENIGCPKNRKHDTAV